MLDEMIQEAAKWPETETGGMMFGKIVDKNSILEITISKTYIPSENDSIRNKTYFEINPDYQREILDKEELLYLGSWHKHLGYGGPSHGDHNQVEEFFRINPHKKIVLAVILDFISEEDYELIIEVYKRADTLTDLDIVETGNYKTFRIDNENIHYYLQFLELR